MVRKKELFISLFIIISTFSVYVQVLNYDFVNFDDNEYVTDNESVKKGFTLESIIWAFTNFHAANWHPLTWISHMIDSQLFGLNAGLHHLTSLILHILNSLLLYYVFMKITGKLWQSCFVAVVFAIHPLHVESVAWISERKDLLSTFWGLLTILIYYWYVQNNNIYRFLLVNLFFSFSLMSKPMLVTMPCLLFLLDYWPLKRLQLPSPNNMAVISSSCNYLTNISCLSIKRLLLEKTPLFFLSFISCTITIFAQHSGQAIMSLHQRPFFERLINALVAYTHYINKILYPINLSPLYPYKGVPQLWEVILSLCLIILISFYSIKTVKSHPYFIVGWLWFLGTLIPVIGLVQVGIQSMADRYTYIPLTGLFIILAWGVPDLLAKWRYKKTTIMIFSSFLVLMFMAITEKQTAYWENGFTLSLRAVNVTKGNYLMETNLANMFIRNRELSKGIIHYIEALRIQPDDNTAYNNLMKVLNLSKTDESVAERMGSTFLRYPKEYGLYFILGKMYRDEKQYEKAIDYFNKSLDMNKQFASSYDELSTLYMLNSELDKSILILQQLIALQPDLPLPYFKMAHIYKLLGDNTKSSEWYQNAIDRGYILTKDNK